MAVDAGEFRCALETVCDIFKIPSLYSEQEKCLEALFKGKDVYASLPSLPIFLRTGATVHRLQEGQVPACQSRGVKIWWLTQHVCPDKGFYKSIINFCWVSFLIKTV